MTKVRNSLPMREGPDRVNYATGVLLGAEDFQAEQDYHRSRLARALVYASGTGTLAGLAVTHEAAVAESETGPARSERLMVDPGLAVDRIGRMIEVIEPRCLKLEDWYQAQTPQALQQALHGAGALWTDSPAGVAADVFIRFATCERGKTPAFASSAFDSFDSVTAARLRDGFELEIILRAETNPSLPAPHWPEFTNQAATLREAIFSAWQEGTAYRNLSELDALPEHVPGQDTGSLFLSRVVFPADPAPAGQRPVRRAAEDVVIRNDLRQFVVTANALARWLDIQVTAEP